MLHSLQVKLNKAARLVTGMSPFTSTRRLMDRCGWLTVKQLVQYHTILMIHKIVMTSNPVYLNSKLNTEHFYNTRRNTTGCIRLDQTYRYKGELPIKSFRCRGAHGYNGIPAELRNIKNLETFKTKLKKWIKSNINPD